MDNALVFVCGYRTRAIILQYIHLCLECINYNITILYMYTVFTTIHNFIIQFAHCLLYIVRLHDS